MKYWIESSWNFEDKDKEFKEHWVVAVDYGEDGTESIATFEKAKADKFDPIKPEIDDLLKHINSELKVFTKILSYLREVK